MGDNALGSGVGDNAQGGGVGDNAQEGGVGNYSWDFNVYIGAHVNTCILCQT